MVISLRSLFSGYYKYCQCGCKILIPCINKSNGFTKFKKGHNTRGQKPGNFRGYRRKYGNYILIYKPHFKYARKDGYVLEHRYIYHIYLSILNGKLTYLPKGYDIHHINGNTKDNRPDKNLILLTRSNHSKEHNPIIDKSDRFCNICKSETTILDWYIDIDGFLCFNCYQIIRYYQKKFNIQLIS